MKRFLFVLAFMLPIAGCAELGGFLASPEGERVAKAAVGAVTGIMGLPPGVGEAIGGTLTAGVLALLGSRAKKA